MGVGLTVLLGTIPILNLDIWTFFIVLISLAGIGFLIFVVFTRLIGTIEQIYTEIDFMFTGGIGNLQMSNGFFITVVSDLTRVSFDVVNNYRVFVQLLTGAVLFTMSNRFEKLSNDYRAFRDFKKHLELEIKSYQENLDFMKVLFQQFDKSKTMVPQDLLEFVEEALKEYKPKDEVK